MTPSPGERLQRFVGDRVRFELNLPGGAGRQPAGWQARLRTNLGRGELLRREILLGHTRGPGIAGVSWRDLPMHWDGNAWSLELPLAEVGFFKAKAFLLDPKGWQTWPAGPDVGISVHPDFCRTANTLYCAFPRLFGGTKTARIARNDKIEDQIHQIEEHGYSILPPSGKLRDLIRCLPHIVETLGCRILQLLPVNPTPTTYARFGRFGSPYAVLDLTAIDPALVVFDKRTTGIDQFCELTFQTHVLGGRVILDIVINHTGWGSVLQENRPEWFLRRPDGTFVSPGAWGTTWEDLVELKHDNVELWDRLAEVFLVWCRRGVDGFRCDAGYKVPVPAWQYIIARVQQEFPETLFLLEGLGGAWEATEALLTEGGMQWAYSELFQNYSATQIAAYLDHSFKQSRRVGLLTHYSETHDNDRLAKRGRAWSLLRNRLCALTSVSGGFGFTCGVEWLATEKIQVHNNTGLAWNNEENLIAELGQLNRLLAEHPCFFDGAKLTRLSAPDSPGYALLRESAEGCDTVLVLVNTDPENPQVLRLTSPSLPAQVWKFDLLGQPLPKITAPEANGPFTATLPPGSAFCLSPTARPVGLSGDDYRRARAQAAWAIQAIHRCWSIREQGPCHWRALAEMVDRSPRDFLGALAYLDPQKAQADFQAALKEAASGSGFQQVVDWTLVDRRRVTLVPPEHWLLIQDSHPFRATLCLEGKVPPQHVCSIPVRGGHAACFHPQEIAADGKLAVEYQAGPEKYVEAAVRFLEPVPPPLPSEIQNPKSGDMVLLTNGIGGMARMCVDLGCVHSKYDCVLGANLHPAVPVDRHIFAKRIRIWLNADGFISPLNLSNLAWFRPGPPATWRFVANAGDGRSVELDVTADMLPGRNTTVFQFTRIPVTSPAEKALPETADVRLTARIDIEDRNFHWETLRNGGAEHHFSTHTRPLGGPPAENRAGFSFTPAPDRHLRVFSDAGEYHPEPEWSQGIPHPIEQSRGQAGFGDAYSPGWFELPLAAGARVVLVVTAETADPSDGELSEFKWRALRAGGGREPAANPAPAMAPTPSPEQVSLFRGDEATAHPCPESWADFGSRLLRAARAFVVRRGSGKTVIAGYPWFLDWGRDTLICSRGLLAAGWLDGVAQILAIFGRFEEGGTLPNSIYGEDTSNRDTSDAPLWFALACEEMAAATRASASGPAGPDAAPASGGLNAPDDFYSTTVGGTRTIRDVLQSIAHHYLTGTRNGIRADPASGLIWSPAHFTWMDTNYPAGTAREGYPVEIQALWIRLLRQLAQIAAPAERRRWSEQADLALASMERLFWLASRGFYADLLLARPGQPATQAKASDALRSNCLFPVSLGVVSGARARQCVAAAQNYLVVPGGLRSLAPLPVSEPLPVCGNDGRLLNNPQEPYWGHYEGDEDTRRKPAYHNGTAWTWTFPVFCEALARAWDFAPVPLAAARAYLGSTSRLMSEGCLGQVPEILDGDAPHTQRGCDAQAWGATEALRVWKLLSH